MAKVATAITPKELLGAANVFSQSLRESRAKREHTAVFRDRFARSCSLLHFIACRILRDPERAQLAVRNCWVRASRNSPIFGNDGEFRSWLLRLLIDEALAILHRSGS
jgi:DNA-directed RNA polymerase specialized sigma24 family protein